MTNNDLTRLRDTDLNKHTESDLMQEVPMLSFKCKVCKKVVAEVSDRFVKDNILYGRLDKFVIYCKKCHDDLDAVQARLQKKATLIFFTNEQLSILEGILEREKQAYIDDAKFQRYLKEDYDLLDVNDPRKHEVEKFINVGKMFRKVVNSVSELGLLGKSQ